MRPGNQVADLPAVLRHLRTLAQHLGGDGEFLLHDGRRALLLRQLERGFPARHRHLARDVFGELDGILGAVLHAEAGDGAAQAEEAHAMAALAHDLVALLLERQAVDLADVVEHAREHLHDFAVFVPVELGEIRERVLHEAREVHRAQQARAVRRQRLLAAVVRMQAIGVELVDARDLHVVHVFEAVGAHALDRGDEALAVQRALVVAQQAREARAFDRVGEADDVGEARDVFARDDQAGLRAVAVDGRGDADAQQHALHAFEHGECPSGRGGSTRPWPACPARCPPNRTGRAGSRGRTRSNRARWRA